LWRTSPRARGKRHLSSVQGGVPFLAHPHRKETVSEGYNPQARRRRVKTFEREQLGVLFFFAFGEEVGFPDKGSIRFFEFFLVTEISLPGNHLKGSEKFTKSVKLPC
jgi:hypothetical protein